MKSILTGIIIAMLLGGNALAQDATPPSTSSPAAQSSQTPAPTSQPAAQNPATANQAQTASGQGSKAPRLAPGSVIPVQLTKTIDAKKVKVGDQVEARVTQDMKAQSGEIVVPKDTKVIGKITEAQARDRQTKESQLAVAFDHMVMKDAGDVPAPMSIQAIIAPSTLQSNNSNAAAEGTAQSAPTSSAGGMTPGNASGRTGSMGAGAAAPPAPTPEQVPTNSQTQAASRPEITGNTQGVVGITGLQLSSAGTSTQGSVVTSEKNNVKLESGTLMLLRVNQ